MTKRFLALRPRMKRKKVTTGTRKIMKTRTLKKTKKKVVLRKRMKAITITGTKLKKMNMWRTRKLTRKRPLEMRILKITTILKLSWMSKFEKMIQKMDKTALKPVGLQA